MCRKEISSQPVYCLVLENAVDRYAETLSSELKQARQQRKKSCLTAPPPEPEVSESKQ